MGHEHTVATASPVRSLLRRSVFDRVTKFRPWLNLGLSRRRKSVNDRSPPPSKIKVCHSGASIVPEDCTDARPEIFAVKLGGNSDERAVTPLVSPRAAFLHVEDFYSLRDERRRA